jgi:hypothetical protein
MVRIRFPPALSQRQTGPAGRRAIEVTRVDTWVLGLTRLGRKPGHRSRYEARARSFQLPSCFCRTCQGHR